MEAESQDAAGSRGIDWTRKPTLLREKDSQSPSFIDSLRGSLRTQFVSFSAPHRSFLTPHHFRRHAGGHLRQRRGPENDFFELMDAAQVDLTLQEAPQTSLRSLKAGC